MLLITTNCFFLKDSDVKKSPQDIFKTPKQEDKTSNFR